MTGTDVLGRVLEKVERRAFLASKLLGPRRDGPPRVVFVAGVQRSGTNMVMEVLEASRAADVVHERDPRAYDNYMMRDAGVIEALIARARRPVFAIKALHESERVRALMDRFAPAKLLWVFRAPDAVIASNRVSWPNGRSKMDEILVDPATAGWHGRGMSAGTLATLRAVYDPSIAIDATRALFYWYRNQLFFDQALDRDPRAMAVDYDALVADPAAAIARIAAFLGIAAEPRMIAHPRAGGARKAKKIDLPPPIRALVSEMHARLRAAAGSA